MEAFGFMIAALKLACTWLGVRSVKAALSSPPDNGSLQEYYANASRGAAKENMIDYLTHYYNIDKGPFQSLSALSDEEAIKIMEKLCDDTPFGIRFKDPIQYLKDRKDTEQWVREEFLAKGGRPKDKFPIPMALGSSKWLVEAAPDREKHAEIRIPLSVLTEYDVSFTYPDSMISRWFGREKPLEYYQPELHGKVFTLSEILSIVEKKGLPEEDWEPGLPKSLAPYIEAQVWNHELLLEYRRQMKT